MALKHHCVIYNPKPQNPTSNEALFNGLVAVVELLCELDNEPNVLDFSKLFEQENGEPVYHVKTFLA